MSKRILIFTERSLAISETFIKAHCESISRYDPTFMVLGDSEHSKSGDVACSNYHLFGRCGPGRVAKLLFRLGWSSTMEAALDDLRPDVIHAHYLTNGAFLLPYAKRRGIPLVVTVHGYDATRRMSRWRPYDRILAARRRDLSRNAAAVLPVSDYLLGKLRSQGFDQGNVHTHYLGIPLPELAPVDLVANPQRIVFAGRLVEKKGIDRVIEAFARLRSRFPDAELHIVGDGPLRSTVDQAAARIDKIVVYGAQPHQRLMEIMRTAQIFTMPSREAANGDSEGLGLTLVEAQAAGIPVVTSRETGTRETCIDGETGILVDPQDVPTIEDAFARLLADPGLRKTMGEAAYAWTTRRFDIHKQTAQLEDLYDLLIAG